METLSPPQAPMGPPPRRPRKGLRIAAVLLSLVLAAVIFVVVEFVIESSRSDPKFPSLADHPDSSLQGTVAYFSSRTQCVRVVAASGRPSKDVLCLAGKDVAKAQAEGKEMGPQLVWLADGRLEVTMFRMTGKGPDLHAGWQKIVDVRTGSAEDVPAANVPSSPNLDTRPTVSPTGQRITTSSNASTGRIKITLTDASGSRTLLSAQGPPNYTYGLNAAFWSPDFTWIAADDGRILIITPGTPAVTRVLTDEIKGAAFGGDDPRQAGFAITSANVFTPGG